MKKYFLVIFLFSHCFLAANALDSLKYRKNSVFVELFGNGYFYSLNYERSIYKINKMEFSARIGLNYYLLHNTTYVPVSIQGYYGKRSRLEIGMGYVSIFRWDKIKEEGTLFNYDRSKYKNTGSAYIKGHDEPYAGEVFINIGLHQNLKHNFFFKISFSPWIGETKNHYAIIPWGKLAFGKTF